ncbi:MAG: PAS domain-containing protein, partial [Calditrichia bacterium]|nr:PAS domain-containing protein [Calditrichia bacterium]
EKYRNLVEAATEGLIMVLDGKYTYSNRTMLDMLDYTEQEFNELDIYDIFYSREKEDNPGFQYFKALMEGDNAPTQFEAKLKRKDEKQLDAVLTISKIEFAGKNGFTIIAKDISKNKEIEEELGESKEKYKALTNNLNIGVFRTTLGRNGTFIEANPAAVSILGFGKPEELFKANITEVFNDLDARQIFIKNLLTEGFVKNRPLEIRKKDGSVIITSVSAVLINDETGAAKYCDGIVEDITEQKNIEKQRENLITELQASSHFMNQPIKHF